MDSPSRILIAEDETIVRLDLGQLLRRAGYEVVGEARDGLEAIALARTYAPDLALVDVKMPRLDGVSAARGMLATRRFPIVMLTAYGYGELVARALDAGVVGYVMKPFREAELLDAVARALGRSPGDGVDLDLAAAHIDVRWPLTLKRDEEGRLDVSLRDVTSWRDAP
jgi:two-component system, response regulator PdtaR